LSKNKNFSDTAANRYSLALYEIADEAKNVKQIEEQSYALIKLIDNSDDFVSVIKNPTNKKEDQLNVINKMSENYNFDALLKKFLCFLVIKRRLFFLHKILKNFLDICSKKRGEVKAKLVAAKN
jgi:F0F1-type ATP synthase, delta subunit (mitochondrial oligomycin sensitivity protein)